MDVPVPGDAAPDLFAGRLLQAASFWELITKRAQASGQQVMLLDEHDRRVSFAGFRDRAERVAAALYEIGIGPGTRVAWQLPTRISTALVMAALARLGAAQAPIIPIYGQRETAAAVESAGAEVILVPGSWRGTDYAEMARGLRSAPRMVVVGEHAPEADAPGSLPLAVAPAGGPTPPSPSWSAPDGGRLLTRALQHRHGRYRGRAADIVREPDPGPVDLVRGLAA
jgi:non-ribosomal peptide synthetase component E (peptide arylation enzyme)